MTDLIEVLITVPFPEELVASLSSISPRLHFNVIKATQAADVLPEVWRQTEVLYTSNVLPSPELAPALSWIQFHWAGVDHAINHPILLRPNLVSTTLSGAAASKVAEFVLMMLLAQGYHLPDLIEHQHRADWPRDRWKRFSPQELRGSKVGIVGYGSIGREVARLLHAIGAEILATKQDAMHPEDPGYAPEGLGDHPGDIARRLYPPQAISTMFRECDFVVVCVPLTPGTRNLIGIEELAALKPTAFLVDVSRGGVINQAALITALRERKIAGAALDVFPEEPLPPDNPLWKLPNVIISPHIAGITRHYDERAVTLFAENLHRYLVGLPLYNQIDPLRGY